MIHTAWLPAQTTQLVDQLSVDHPDVIASVPTATMAGPGPGIAEPKQADLQLWRLDAPRANTAPPSFPATAHAGNGGASDLPTLSAGPSPANRAAVAPAALARSGLNRRRFLIGTGVTGLGAIGITLWARKGADPTTPTVTGNPTTPTTTSTVTRAQAGSTHTGARTVAFSPDGHTLAGGSEQTGNAMIQLWTLS